MIRDRACTVFVMIPTMIPLEAVVMISLELRQLNEQLAAKGLPYEIIWMSEGSQVELMQIPFDFDLRHHTCLYLETPKKVPIVWHIESINPRLEDPC